MSIRKRFNEAFGLEDTVEAERERFVERVNQIIFHEIDTTDSGLCKYSQLFEFLCIELGVNAHDFPQRSKYPHRNVGGYVSAAIRTLTKDDFDETLRILCALYYYFQHDSDNEKSQEWLTRHIEILLSLCSRDIGIRWKDGLFYPSGAEELDEVLIEETVTWLNDYPKERKDYQRALECYSEGQSFPDVVKNCYLVAEGVAREILGNTRTLDNNKESLLKRIDLSDGWKSILANYIKYAHDYRHASEDRHEIKKREAEAYLYMTGLMIRLIIESK